MNQMELQNLADQLGLGFASDISVIYGHYQGYTLFIQSTGQKQYDLSFSVKAGTEPVAPEAVRSIVERSDVLTGSQVSRYRVTFNVKSGMTKSKTQENILQAVPAVTAAFQEQGWTNACEQSGESGQIDVYQLGGNLLILSPESFENLSAGLNLEESTYQDRKENIPAGILGAFLGSLVGGLVTLIIAQMNYVSMVSGLAMGYATIKGYELLGKKISNVGVAVSVAFMLVVTFLVNQLDWTIWLLRMSPNTGLLEAFTFVNYSIFNGDFPDNYWLNLILLYVFTGIGTFAAMQETLTHKKQRYITRKL